MGAEAGGRSSGARGHGGAPDGEPDRAAAVCLGTSGTVIVVMPVTGIVVRPTGVPSSVAMTVCGVLNRFGSPWSWTASVPPVHSTRW